MKVAVTSQGPHMTSEIDPRFGRAEFLVIVDLDTGEVLAQNNALNLNAVQGAGIQAAQNVVRLGASALITGNVGPKAFVALQAGGVEVCTGATGTVREAVERFKSGRLERTDKASVEGHWA